MAEIKNRKITDVFFIDRDMLNKWTQKIFDIEYADDIHIYVNEKNNLVAEIIYYEFM